MDFNTVDAVVTWVISGCALAVSIYALCRAQRNSKETAEAEERFRKQSAEAEERYHEANERYRKESAEANEKYHEATERYRKESEEATNKDRELTRLNEKARAAVEVTRAALEVIAEARDLIRFQRERWGDKYDAAFEDNKAIIAARNDAKDAIDWIDDLIMDRDNAELAETDFVRLQTELNTVLHAQTKLKMIAARIEYSIQPAVL